MSLAMFMAVGAGGALGAMSCYGVAQLVGGGLFSIAGPMATLLVNVAGSSLMGFIAIGFLGALTTFSSFALDTGQLAARQGMAMTALFVGLSVGLSLAAFSATQAHVTVFFGRMPT